LVVIPITYTILDDFTMKVRKSAPKSERFLAEIMGEKKKA
jgi:hypothetical protein